MNRIIYTTLVSCIVLISFAQSTKIDPTNFDNRLYERILFNQMNDFRVENGKSKLVKNFYLYKVANDHNQYLKDKKELTHEQTTPGKNTIQDRLKAYLNVTSYSVGENLARTFVLKPTRNYMRNGKTASTVAKTYEEAATYTLNAWIHSPVHKDNLLDSGFELSAIASYYNPINQSLTSVQVFAKL